MSTICVQTWSRHLFEGWRNVRDWDWRVGLREAAMQGYQRIPQLFDAWDSAMSQSVFGTGRVAQATGPEEPTRPVRSSSPIRSGGKPAQGNDWRTVVDRLRPVTQTLWRSLGDSASAVRRTSGTAVGCASPSCRTTDRRPASGRAAIGRWSSLPAAFCRLRNEMGRSSIVPAPWCAGSGDPTSSPRHQLHWSGP